MEELNSHDERTLRAQLDESQARIAGLEGELRGVDGELEDLSIERQQHDLLREACGALEKLGELGADALFWEIGGVQARGAEHLRLVREHVDAFHQRIGEIDQRRAVILDRILKEQEHSELLEDDLYELALREEQRKQEWIVERQDAEDPPRFSLMPWSRGGEDDRRFRKSLAISLALSILFGLLLPMIDIPIPDKWEVVEVPERFTKLIKEKTPPPAPEPKPIEKLVEESSEEKSDEPKLAEETPKPAAKDQAKPAAASKGILAFREKFAGLAASRPSSKLGAKARISNTGDSPSGQSTRSLVTSNAPGTSGGIDVASLSRDVGGGGGGSLEGVGIAQVTSAIGEIGGPERPLSGGPGPARTDEEIQIVFDRHKAALYRLYNRELRKNPLLRGQIVLRISIEPDGSVSLCEVSSSDMKAPQLSSQVVSRVKNFDFGAKEGVSAITILYPIDFLPAT